jgi:hypothetical protein
MSIIRIFHKMIMKIRRRNNFKIYSLKNINQAPLLFRNIIFYIQDHILKGIIIYIYKLILNKNIRENLNNDPAEW